MPQKVSLATFGAAAALLLATACASAAPARRGSPAPAAVGTTLQLEAPALDGGSVDLGPGSGKVRVVDFWASWCEPCRHELPHLDRLARDFRGDGVEVFGVAVDDDRADVTAFLEEVRVQFPILWDRAGLRSNAAKLPLARLPTTLIVDRRGVIRFVHEGWTERVGSDQRKQVEALLKE